LIRDLLLVSGVAAGVVAALMVVTTIAVRRAGRFSVVDTTWGLAFVAVALSSAVLSVGIGTSDPLPWIVLALVGVWGLRLALHMHRRNHGAGEDPRYAEMLGDTPFGKAALRVFGIQGLAAWLVSWPIQEIAVTGSDPLWWLAAGGVLVWAVGVGFEAVGDAQLAAYKRSPDRPPVLDTGLWRYTRHPNYFGDACVWWGIWLIAASTAWWVAPATVVASVAMTYFLVHATGARLLEETMMKRPGYPEYAARTSMFLALPPRRGAHASGPPRGPLG
jgi:steroid 5-alpha reductase family enzyme